MATGDPAASRTDKSTLSNMEEFLYSHLKLSLTVDFERKRLEGTATWTATVVKPGVTELVLDTSSLDVRSVTVCGVAAGHMMQPAHSAFGAACTILLPEGYLREQGTVLEVAVTYATSPDSSALQWLRPAQTAGKKYPYMFTQCQAIHARTMLPCIDGTIRAEAAK